MPRKLGKPTDWERAAIKAAIRAAGAVRLANEFGISRIAIYQWIRNGVPRDRVLRMADLSGISPYALRSGVNWDAVRQAETMPPTSLTPAESFQRRMRELREALAA